MDPVCSGRKKRFELEGLLTHSGAPVEDRWWSPQTGFSTQKALDFENANNSMSFNLFKFF